MTERFRNRYRIASARAEWWSYGWAGAYFITICSRRRSHFFGQIICGRMTPSSIGTLAYQLWVEIPNHSHNVVLGAFVVMPNHVHGILILTTDASDEPIETVDPGCDLVRGITIDDPFLFLQRCRQS